MCLLMIAQKSAENFMLSFSGEPSSRVEDAISSKLSVDSAKVLYLHYHHPQVHMLNALTFLGDVGWADYSKRIKRSKKSRN